jgi:hypothetical protein
MVKYRQWWLGIVLAISIGDAGAASFGSFDPRSMAMGGTGVADGRAGDAAYFNPALLAAQRASDDFSLDFPVFGITLGDPDNVRDGVDNFQNNDNTTKFSDAITVFQTTPSQPNADAAVAAGTALLNDLEGLANKALLFDANVGLSVAVPSEKAGVGVIVDGRALGGVLLDITNADIQAVNDALTKIQNLDPTVTDPTQNFTSVVLGRGAILSEVGVALAHKFNIGGRAVALGVTPKFVRADTFDYAPGVNDANIDLNQGRKSENSMNLDIGAAARITDSWKAGVVIKNVVPHDYTTSRNNVIKSNPQVRAGVAFEQKLYTVAVDIDLTNNDPAGLEPATQYIAVGGEFDAWGWAQLRAGYRYNMKDNKTSAGSLGVGVSPFGVHMDLAVIASANLLGAGFETGFRF